MKGKNCVIDVATFLNMVWARNWFLAPFWTSFWLRTEQEWAEHEKKTLYYDAWPDCPSDGCEECEDTLCPQRRSLNAQDEECDYTGDECIDTVCRRDGCVGCEILAPPSKEELVEEACPCCG